ncbi:hypothetical protein C4D60_Mb11t04130 [Musa balbisiana]|uniref:Uncharacterized protein n=1 Tax=Musa balbisiana TaxID=52838 RepID=A0A4S8J1Q5_MUSBA|nr:hypothetical protein C4D60_Mb11t04130 [Musa balbisiana]
MVSVATLSVIDLKVNTVWFGSEGADPSNGPMPRWERRPEWTTEVACGFSRCCRLSATDPQSSHLAVICWRKLKAVPTHGVVAGMSELEGMVMEVVMTFALVYTVYATVADPKKGPFGTADMVNSDHMPLHASGAGFTPNNTYKTAARTIGGKAAPEEHPELPFLNFVCIHSI